MLGTSLQWCTQVLSQRYGLYTNTLHKSVAHVYRHLAITTELLQSAITRNSFKGLRIQILLLANNVTTVANHQSGRQP